MKALIISHNPITTYQNMGRTMLSLFSSFGQEELCQLYIYPTMPDIAACHSYFRMTDRDILRSCWRLGRVPARILREADIRTDQHDLYETQADEAFFRRHRRNALTLLGRDLVWQFSRWYGAELKRWLEEERPTCIFVAPGESAFLYGIALKLAKRLQIPLYAYVCDDLYFLSMPKGLIARLQRRLLKRRIDQLMRHSQAMIAICDELAESYADQFGIRTEVIHTGSVYPIADAPREQAEVGGLTYLGLLSHQRYLALAQVGRALDIINDRAGTRYTLSLYTDPPSPQAEQTFSSVRSIRLLGFVTGEAFERALRKADILLHVEAFDAASVERVRYSISTKIADSLGSGVPLMAFAPAEVASMRYLRQNRAAVCVTEPEELVEALQSLLEDGRLRHEVTQAALALARREHDAETSSRRLYAILGNPTTIDDV